MTSNSQDAFSVQPLEKSKLSTVPSERSYEEYGEGEEYGEDYGYEGDISWTNTAMSPLANPVVKQYLSIQVLNICYAWISPSSTSQYGRTKFMFPGSTKEKNINGV
jgi:hypothetical protein